MKLKFLLFICSVVFLASCGSKKKVVNKRNPGVVIVEPKPIKLPSVDEEKHVRKLEKKSNNLDKNALVYIEKYAPIAVKEMHEYKIPASITLAQGILESGSGKGELALKSNNHFGIKCHTQWQGERVYHDDDKDKECFRKYVYVETSYNDHSLFLTQRKRYAALFSHKITDYKRWAKGLKKAGYATDKKYPEKLIGIIERYKLYEFDRIRKSDYTKKIKKLNNGKSYTKPVVIEKAKQNYYEVKKGDTLYSLSKKFNISIENLKAINNLDDNIISIGQKLLIKQ